MKKSVYALCGAVMVIVAVLVRSLAGGGAELMALLAVGVLLLVGSIDFPAHTKEVSR